MSEGTKHAAGTPSWADLGTTDAEAATAFYSNVFGWETEKTSAGPAGDYVLCRLDGALVAGLYEQDQAMKQRGVPPMWLVYVSVDDVVAAAAAVPDGGGTVHGQPFEVGDAGRMALVQDPTGAMFALWQARKRPGAEAMHAPGAMDWFELATDDPEKAGAFYEQVLGWDVQREEFDGTAYTTCRVGDEAVAGILPGESLPEGVPPNWSVYFAVEDCAATIEKAQQAGAELIFGPQDMPSVGQFAGLRDPQGAAFAVIQPVAEQAEQREQAEDESEAGREEGDGDTRDESPRGEDEEPSEDESDDDEPAKNEGKDESDDEKAEKSDGGRSEKGETDQGDTDQGDTDQGDTEKDASDEGESDEGEPKDGEPKK